MNPRNRVLLLILILSLVVLVVETITVSILYKTAIEQQKSRLVEIAKSQARLIESIARFSKTDSKFYSLDARKATLSQLVDAHSNYEGFGDTGEFTLATKENDQIVFLLSHRHYDLNQPKPVLWDSKWAEPMRQALSRKSGTIIGLDYRGEKVLAAHEPVGELKLGIVAKIDLSEVREPFIRAGLLSGSIAIVLIALGVCLFFTITNPLLKRLQDTSEKTKRFAYSVAHDLKNPSIAIFGLTRRLRNKYNDVLDEKGRNICDHILKSSEQIASLVENINLYISTAKNPMEIDKINLRDVFQTIKEEFNVPLNSRHIRLTESELLPEIIGDKLALLRVMRNFVDNSLKYGGKDLSEIEIGYKESDKYHILYVSDNGVGFSKEDSKKIFEFSERGTTSIDIEGSGLGLAIVKEIAEHHKGNAWCKSNSQGGAEFFISINKHLQSPISKKQKQRGLMIPHRV